MKGDNLWERTLRLKLTVLLVLIDPNDIWTLLNRARIYTANKQKYEAFIDIEHLLDLEPGNARAWELRPALFRHF